MKILVVGAGPTGLTAALELARRGTLPTIVDRRDDASTLSRAVGITPRSLGLLSPSGVAERLIAEGIAIEGVRIYLGDELALSLRLHSDQTFFPTILGLPQDRTEALMAEALTALGGAVRYSEEVVHLAQHGEGVAVRFADGREERYDQVIGADGARSTVREAAGINFRGFDLPETWSIADVDAKDWRHPEQMTLVRARPGTVGVVVPIGESRYRVVMSHEDALGVLPLPLDVTRVRREGTFKIAVRQAETYSSGRIHLAGDAAHCHSPVGGRGMNLGIADAAELAKRLLEGDLEGYSPVRHREGAETIAATERGRKIASGQTLPRRLLFRAMLTVANLFPPARKRMGRFAVEF